MSATTALSELIRREIEAHGTLSFARFMHLALYAPTLGYYEREETRIGRQGDFYTSVSVGGLFGELLAFHFAEQFAKCAARHHDCGTVNTDRGSPPFQIAEAGAHDGRLAADLLGWLRERRPGLLPRLEYWIIEPSAARQAQQQELLAGFRPRVQWTDSPCRIPHSAFRILFCNELLDALPVHRIGWDSTAKRWFEWGVRWEDDRFVWRRMPEEEEQRIEVRMEPQTLGQMPSPVRLPVSAMADAVQAAFRLPHSALEEALPDGYTLDLNLAAERWWRETASTTPSGQLLAIDYGFTADELLMPERTRGTLRAYHRHHLSLDPLALPGEQDLTAHLNFTALPRAGESAGFNTLGVFTQAQFLTHIASRAWASREGFGEWTARHTRQFQTLTHPDHLGRAFRVLVQSREA